MRKKKDKYAGSFKVKDLSKLGKAELLDIVLEQSKALEELQPGSAPEDLPSTAEVQAVYDRVSYRKRLLKSIQSTTGILIVVAAVSVLVAVLFLPVLRIYGESMKTTLKSDDLVVSVKGADFDTGDIVAFYYNNNILVKRVIAGPGDWVDIDINGNVFVNQEQVDEPYISQKAFGEPDVEFPYQVPEERYFVLGDNRETSIDSRYKSVGCITKEQVVGRIVFRIWPLSRIGPLR